MERKCCGRRLGGGGGMADTLGKETKLWSYIGLRFCRNLVGDQKLFRLAARTVTFAVPLQGFDEAGYPRHGQRH